MAGKVFSSRFAGTCQCGRPIGKGDTITHDRATGKVTSCAVCRKLAVVHPPGTKAVTRGAPAMGGFDAVPGEPVTICKPGPENLPLPGPGWYVVEFANGKKLCMHHDDFVVKPAIQRGKP